MKFIFSLICSRYKSCPSDSDNQELNFFTFSIISYQVFTGNAYPSFLLLWIVIGISRVFSKTLMQRPLLVIVNDLPKISALWLFGFGTIHACLIPLVHYRSSLSKLLLRRSIVPHPSNHEKRSLILIRHYQIYRFNYVLCFRISNPEHCIIKINHHIKIPDEICHYPKI